MKLLAVLKWMLFFTLSILIAAGVGGFWLWQNSNGMIREKVLQAFDRIAPEMELRIDEIQLLSSNSVRLTGVEVRDRRSNRALLRAAELRAVVDEAELVERQQVLVKSVRVSGVDILLKRHADGRWNWQEYRFEKRDDVPFIPPSVILENVRAQVQLEHGDGIPPASLIVSTSLFQAIPRSGEAYEFTGLVTLPGAGDLAVNGDCDLKNFQWKLGGRLTGISANQNLLELAKATAPQLAERLLQLDETMAGVLPDPTPVQTASSEKDSASLVIGASGVAPRFLGILDVDFNVEKLAGSSVPDLRLKVEVRNGQLSSPVVPIRLTDVRAKFFWDNSNVVFQLLHGRDGEALITGEFLMQIGENAEAPEARLHLKDVPISKELKPLLPPRSQRLFDHFQPVGKVSGDITFRRFPSGKWLPVDVSGVAEEASVLFHRFRCPVTGIVARMTQRPMSPSAESLNDAIIDIVANGTIGTRPLTAVGWMRNPGPEAEMRFDLHVDDFPLDSRFRDALDDQGRRVMDAININGLTSADIACYRTPGLDRPTDMVVKADVKEARMQFRGFPYEIARLTGKVEFKSAEKSWTFTDLHGWHGSGELSAEGTFRGRPAPGELDLTIKTQNAELDADLFHALNESSRSLWTMINPEGHVSLTTHVAWTAAPGQKAVVRLDDVEISTATIYPTPFPYRMSIKSARVSYDPNDPRAAGMQHCEIESMVAEHDGSLITASGWAGAGNDGFWQLHLNDLNAMDLKPDDSLRAALPGSWRETLSRLAQTGLISIEASELDFRGVTNNQAPTTAAWKMNLRLKDCEVAAGLDLKKVSGLVKANGTWDGYRLANQGTIRLDQVEVLDMTIAGINGPYSMTEDELVLGSRGVILGQVRPVDVSPEDRIQGQAYGGSLEMDGLIDLQAGGNYRFFGELKNALLENYAARHVPDQPNMKGVVNSWIFVHGNGDSAANLKGKGQLQINPAALYEVPVILEMFSALSRLNFTVPNRTAFDYALMSFHIEDQAFWFDPIDLVGDALALRGRGSVGFGGDVVLDFFSRPARPRGPRIPFSGLLMSSATQWVNVQVRGTVDRPQTSVGSKMQLDESMRQFLSTFEPRPDGPIPTLTIPSVFGPSPAPQAMRP